MQTDFKLYPFASFQLIPYEYSDNVAKRICQLSCLAGINFKNSLP